MYAATSCSDPPASAVAQATPSTQRAAGRSLVVFGQRAGVTCLDRLYQDGAAKVRVPRVTGAAPEAVLINTAG